MAERIADAEATPMQIQQRAGGGTIGEPRHSFGEQVFAGHTAQHYIAGVDAARRVGVAAEAREHAPLGQGITRWAHVAAEQKA